VNTTPTQRKRKRVSETIDSATHSFGLVLDRLEAMRKKRRRTRADSILSGWRAYW
jgi:hypothetical protein